MSYCPKCGDELYEGSVFCMNCGFKLPTKHKQSPEASEEPHSSEFASVESISTNSVQVITKKRNKKKIIIISLIAVLIAALAAGAVWFFFLRATNTNFLNIAWGESKANVNDTISRAVEKTEYKYKLEKGSATVVEGDPFFGLENSGTLYISPIYNEQNGVDTIGILITSDYDAEETFNKIVESICDYFGSPDIKTTEEQYYKASWKLDKTKIDIEISQSGIRRNSKYWNTWGTIHFNPTN